MNETFTTRIKFLVLALCSLLLRVFYSSDLANKELAFLSGRVHHPKFKVFNTLSSEPKDNVVSWLLLLKGRGDLSYWFDGEDTDKEKVSLEEISGEGSETIGNEIIPSGATVSKDLCRLVNTGFFGAANGENKWVPVHDFASTHLHLSTASSIGFTGKNIRMYVTKTLLL